MQASCQENTDERFCKFAINAEKGYNNGKFVCTNKQMER